MQKIILLFLICIISMSNAKAQPTFEYLDSPIIKTNVVNNAILTKGKGDTAISAFLFDEGYLTGERIPGQPYRIIHINLMTGNYDIIPVIRKNSIDSPQTSMGKMTTGIWAKNGKYYLASQLPGHLVEFNPSTNAVKDFGSIVNSNIYSLQNGQDSALYGGSWGYDKTLFTFRYDPTTDSLYTHNTIPLETGENNYVTEVIGNKDYTYAVVGKEHYKLYALHRATNTVTLIQDRTDGGTISLRASADSIYSVEWHGVDPNILYKSWKIDGTTITYRGDNNFNYPANSHPFTNEFPPIPADTLIYPQVIWDEINSKVLWRFNNDTTVVHEKTITGINAQTRSIGFIQKINENEIVGAGRFYAKLFKYNTSSSAFTLLSNTPSLYSKAMLGNNICFGSYGGKIYKYNPDSALTTGASFTPIPETSVNANPRVIGDLRNEKDPDPSKHGPGIVNGLAFINDTLAAFCGPVDTDGTRAGLGNSIGTFTLSGVRTYCTDTITKDVYIAGGILGDNKNLYCYSYGDQSYIYKYNTTNNTIEKRISTIYPTNTGVLTKGVDNQIVGWIGTKVYFISEISDEIYKSIEIPNANILSVKLGYDNMLWAFSSLGQYDGHFTFYKINPYDGEYSTVFSFTQAENTGELFTDFIFMGGTAYLAGNKRLARVNNLTTPVSNSYLSLFEKANGILNFEHCD